LYKSQPSLMAATQAFAAKRREIGSISRSCYAVRSHTYATIYGCKFASVPLEPVLSTVTVWV